MTREVRLRHRELLSLDKIYSDTYMTRAYVMYNDCFTDAPKKRFEALKTIWENKKIMIVEGAQTRLGVGNDLFDNATSIRRVLAPATNSFDRYEEILEYCKEHGTEADLFILAIGPSSGVLAFDLSKIGYQAVDVGHIDLEYEWFLAGKGERVSVPNKYNNEVVGGDNVAEFFDERYETQIAVRF